MALITAYFIYDECCDGELDPSWAVPKKEQMTRKFFQQRLGEQMMLWDPRLGLYPGEERTRKYLQLGDKRRNTKSYKDPKKRRQQLDDECDNILKSRKGISPTDFQNVVCSGRLVTSMNGFKEHCIMKKTATTKCGKFLGSTRNCYVCGKPTRAYCSCCQLENEKFVSLCYFDQRREVLAIN